MFSSLRTLAWATIAFLGLGLLVDIGAFVSQIALWLALGQDGGAAPSTRDTHRLVLTVVLVSRVMLYGLTFVSFVAWLYQAYRNLDALGARRRSDEKWAILGFLVPFMNLVRPFEIVHEVWEGSRPSRATRAPSTIVPWWWALVVLCVLLECFVWIPSMQMDGPAAVLPLHVLLTLLRMGAAVLTVLLVQEISRRQEERHLEKASPVPQVENRWRNLDTVDSSHAPADLELVVTAGADRGKVFPLIGAEIVVGRQDRTGTAPWGAIAVEEGSVSRVHAVLQWNAARNIYTIQHKSRTNLTVLNGRSLGDAIVPLTPGDHIRMGRLEMTVRLRSQEPAGAGTPILSEKAPLEPARAEPRTPALDLPRDGAGTTVEAAPPPLPRRRLELSPPVGPADKTIRIDDGALPLFVAPPSLEARPPAGPVPPLADLAPPPAPPTVPVSPPPSPQPTAPDAEAPTTVEETPTVELPPPPPPLRLSMRDPLRNPEKPERPPARMFGFGEVMSAAPPPMQPHPVPPPGLIPGRQRRDVPAVPHPGEEVGARKEGSKTAYIPTAQLVQLPTVGTELETGQGLERLGGVDAGGRTALRRTAYMLGRRDHLAAEDDFRIPLDDVYLPRDHAVMLWDDQEGAYRLHLLETSLVTTRVTRVKDGQARDFLVTARQPFTLQLEDEIALGDSRVKLVRM